MLIQIVRSTVAAVVGERPRAVDPGEVVEVERLVAAQLIGLGKAIAVTPETPAGGIVQTPEDALTEMEIRPAGARRGKRK
jgi:hypothetical protein